MRLLGGCSGGLADVAALAVDGLDEAGALEFGEGLAGGAAGDAVAVHKGGFGGEGVAWAQRAGGDVGAQLGGDAAVLRGRGLLGWRSAGRAGDAATAGQGLDESLGFEGGQGAADGG